VWRDLTPGNNEIFFRASVDSGSTFKPPLNSAPTNLSNTPDFSDYQKIAASGSNVFVAWRDSGNLLFTASTDGGNSFVSPAITLSGTQGILGNQGLWNPPQIAAAGSTVYLAWDGSNPSLQPFFTTSSNAG